MTKTLKKPAATKPVTKKPPVTKPVKKPTATKPTASPRKKPPLAETPSATAGGAVAFFGADAARTASFAGALPQQFGRARWKYRSATATTSSAVAVYGDLVLANYEHTGLVALDRDSGKPRWTRPLGRKGGLSSPAVADGRVYVVGQDSGQCHAIDLATQQTLWVVDCGRESDSSPVVVGDLVVVGTALGSVLGIETSTGKVRWSAEIPGKEWVLCAVSSADGVAVVGTWNGHEKGHLVCIDLANGRQRWCEPTAPMSESGAALLKDGVVFTLGGLSGLVVARDLATGRVRWRHDVGKSALWGAPAHAAGLVVFTGAQRLVALDAKQGAVRWTVPLEDYPRGRISPIVVDDAVVMPLHKSLRTWSLSDGKPLWEWKGESLASGPAVAADGRLYVPFHLTIVAL